MLSEHYLFIGVSVIGLALILSATVIGVNEGITGNAIRQLTCEPKTCAERGLEPAGIFYCDKNNCYRDCYQENEIIERATFCKKELK
ncbi:MAG TPA: hypothetical protein VI790_04720 [Candidatus Nanoarchaeia archaeon]|nr:hypothetical protein [Candidatus Nanoarchaeia archaeon]